jgi:hypothetical protein
MTFPAEGVIKSRDPAAHTPQGLFIFTRKAAHGCEMIVELGNGDPFAANPTVSLSGVNALP